MRGEGKRLHLELGQCERAARSVADGEPHVARFRFRQRQVVVAAVAVDHGVDITPLLAIVGQLHQIVGGVLIGLPAQHKTTEFAQLAQIQRQLRIGIAVQVRRPGGAGLAVHRHARRTGGERHGGTRRARQRRTIVDRQRLERQLVEADRSLAADVVVDGEFERLAPAQHAVRIRTPRLVDVALLVTHGCPRCRVVVLRPVDPPDVVATGIDHLELQVVSR